MQPLDAPESEVQVLRRVVRLLVDCLPKGWSAELTDEAAQVDGVLAISDGDGNTSNVVLEAKQVVEGRDMPALRSQLEDRAQRVTNVGALVVAARYLSPPVRQRLMDAGLSYIDATGNVRVTMQRPGLFISQSGADHDPWRGPGRPRGTLKGEPAARIVRAIADFDRSWTARELVEVSGASTGATYRVIDFLEREGLAERDAARRVMIRDWPRLLRRWSEDYGLLRTNESSRWIAPRGLPALLDRIAAVNEHVRYVATGTVAAAERAPYAPARLAVLYVDDPEAAADAWGLRESETGTNVVLVRPKFDVVYARSDTDSRGLTVAAPSQLVVDLMTGPGRNPSEAEELLDWMQRNERDWRN